MVKTYLGIFLFSSLLFPALTNAKTLLRDDDDFELEPMFKDKTWDMSAELGILITSGTTQSTSFLAKANANHEWQNWRMQYSFNALYKKDDVYDAEQQKEVFKTSAEKYIAQGWLRRGLLNVALLLQFLLGKTPEALYKKYYS